MNEFGFKVFFEVLKSELGVIQFVIPLSIHFLMNRHLTIVF